MKTTDKLNSFILNERTMINVVEYTKDFKHWMHYDAFILGYGIRALYPCFYTKGAKYVMYFNKYYAKETK